ncbi:hypothetical protein A6E15_16255 [Natrinema saccharevitans]|uniref:PH domain-containing protein n=1 Tax=Natrinema saccharevitans TaxID=301967 RepID=A0A1S8B0T9_9EURY|nr:hypothetical protein [Natrinema saccharevitans]OLZ42421.1 hypothetical protein A6E15_16255 [Natrinema saccharevitans]
MTYRSLEATESPDVRFRLAFGAYVGLLVAGVAAVVVVAFADPTATALLGTAVAAFLGGCLAGVGLASRVRGLAVRLGRTWGRRATLVLLPVPFGLAAAASLVTPLESPVGVVALAAAVAVAVAGSVLRWLAATRSADALTPGDPTAAWRWESPSRPRLDALLLLAMWLLLGIGDGLAGNWAGALVWAGLALAWAADGLAEGRWRLGSIGSTPEIRVYENGLVKRRPYTREFVPWDDVAHVRLREDELVLDRGLFDVRFDRDELPDLEAVRAEIEGRVPNGATG